MGFNPQLIDSVACISFHLQDMKTIIILSIIAQGNDDKKNFILSDTMIFALFDNTFQNLFNLVFVKTF